ncbi:Uncharacterised protein [Rhodococcus wratislaviensis]|uniref:Uncharacterized protein n=1 Tax=Rhodococcus wratislaviensis TaxID=44752 RepID=A0AB38FFJ4_RHOWR|nr:Uncharacterised protein [Rhodococcus wratislaviensis]
MYVVPARFGSGSYTSSRFQPRLWGYAPTALRPSRTSRHRSSGQYTLPGYLQAIPTITIGSSSLRARAGPAGCGTASSPSRRATSSWVNASAVGWSNTTVAASRTPVAVAS